MLTLLCGCGEHGCNLFNEDNWIHQGKKVKKEKTVIHFLLKSAVVAVILIVVMVLFIVNKKC